MRVSIEEPGNVVDDNTKFLSTLVGVKFTYLVMNWLLFRCTNRVKMIELLIY